MPFQLDVLDVEPLKNPVRIPRMMALPINVERHWCRRSAARDGRARPCRFGSLSRAETFMARCGRAACATRAHPPFRATLHSGWTLPAGTAARKGGTAMSRREHPAAARMKVSAGERVDRRDMAGPTAARRSPWCCADSFAMYGRTGAPCDGIRDNKLERH